MKKHKWHPTLLLYKGHSKVALYLPGSEVPSDFQFQAIGSGLSFIVPQDVGEKIRGWIVCAVVCNPYAIYVRQEVINKTKGTISYHPPRQPDGQYICQFIHGRPDDIMWLNYASVSGDGYKVERGDEVDLRFICYDSNLAAMIECCVVRCGMSLIDGTDILELNKEANDHPLVDID